MVGTLEAAPAMEAGRRETLLWRSPAFTTPFEFHLDEIRGVRFPGRQPGGETGAWKIVMRDGDVLLADIEALDDTALAAALPGAGRRQSIRIDRAAIDRVSRSVGGPQTGYVGPTGLAGWKQTQPGSWVDVAGAIRSQVRGATVMRDVGGAERAVYEVVLSWRQQPACRVAIAAGDDDTPYQLELFPGAEGDAMQVLLVREEKDRASGEPLPEAAVAGADAMRRLRVALFVDQARGRLAVIFPDTSPEPVADVTIPPAAGRRPSGRFRLTSGGDIELTGLRVTEWLGEEAKLENVGRTVVVRRDGTRLTGGIGAWPAEAVDLEVQAEGGAVKVPLADLREIVFPEARQPAQRRPPLRVTCGDGQSIGGDLVRIEDGRVWLRREGIDQPVGLAVEDAVAIESLSAAAEPRPLPGRGGRLRAPGLDVKGALAAVPGGVGWRPAGSASAAGFAVPPGAGAVLEYVERATEAAGEGGAEVGGIGGMVGTDDDGFFIVTMLHEDGAARVQGRMEVGDRVLAVAPEKGAPFVEAKGLDAATLTNLLRGRVGTPLRLKVSAGDGTRPREIEVERRFIGVMSDELMRAALTEHTRLAPVVADVAIAADGFSALVFLRTGDVLPCAVDAIDPDGIRIRTPLGEASRREAVAVPAAMVQAVELLPAAASRTIDKVRMERLLTVPRMQRNNPPTHLLRLTDGDYLRGRVVALDGKTLTFAMADAVKELPRATVARVIWLHPDTPPEGEPPPPAPPAGDLLVQGVAADGRRITLVAETLEGTAIRGRSPAIGPAEIDTEAVDRLLIGRAIEEEARSQPYSQWKLKPAPEPRALRKPAAG